MTGNDHSNQSPDKTPESPHRPLKIAKFSYQEEGTMGQNPSTIQRYLVAVEYIGTRFSGAQQQAPNCRTVVGVLQSAFHKFIGQPVSIFCGSRTDAGVHALSNVCHVDVERISKRKPGEVLPPHEPSVVKKAVNHFLQVSSHLDKSSRPSGTVAAIRKCEGDIMITDVRCVAADFHARYKAQERTKIPSVTSAELSKQKVTVGDGFVIIFQDSRTTQLLYIVDHLGPLKPYFYRLLSGPEALSTFEKDRAWHVPEELDIKAMQEACKVLVGLHDFSSFRASGCQAKSPIRSLDELNVIEVFPSPYFPSARERETQSSDMSLCSEQMGDLSCGSTQHKAELSIGEACDGFGMRRQHRCFVVTARARSFLYHQVRLLVGAIKSVGTGDLRVSDVEEILEAKTVTANAPMAPAHGLYLAHVKYDLP